MNRLTALSICVELNIHVDEFKHGGYQGTGLGTREDLYAVRNASGEWIYWFYTTDGGHDEVLAWTRVKRTQNARAFTVDWIPIYNSKLGGVL